jgi:hypothetical protein
MEFREAILGKKFRRPVVEVGIEFMDHAFEPAFHIFAGNRKKIRVSAC